MCSSHSQLLTDAYLSVFTMLSKAIVAQGESTPQETLKTINDEIRQLMHPLLSDYGPDIMKIVLVALTDAASTSVLSLVDENPDAAVRTLEAQRCAVLASIS